MDDWRNCENCKDQICYEFMVEQNIATEEICDYYEPLRCRCGGALSTTRYDKDGRPYRHCYSCHMEFYEDEEGT